MKRHEKTHLEEKPFECIVCGKYYKSNHGMKTHLIKSHSGEDHKSTSKEKL